MTSAMPATTLVISRADLAVLLRRIGIDVLMDAMIDRLEKALSVAPPWQYGLPPRAGFAHGVPQRNLLEWMPYMGRDGRATIKVVSYAPANPAMHRVPTIIGNVAGYELETGHMFALADGVLLTALRTGAASAVATRVLAHRQARVLGLIGAGTQAVTQLHAISRVRQLSRVLVYDVDLHRAESFVQRGSFAGLEIIVCGRDRVARESDILCTATSVPVGGGPVFDDDQLVPHLHVNAVGSDMPGKFELPKSLLVRSFVCADFIQQAVSEGECQQLAAFHGPDLRELVQAGTAMEIEAGSLDPLDPYGFTREECLATVGEPSMDGRHSPGGVSDVSCRSVEAF